MMCRWSRDGSCCSCRRHAVCASMYEQRAGECCKLLSSKYREVAVVTELLRCDSTRWSRDSHDSDGRSLMEAAMLTSALWSVGKVDSTVAACDVSIVSSGV